MFRCSLQLSHFICNIITLCTVHFPAPTCLCRCILVICSQHERRSLCTSLQHAPPSRLAPFCLSLLSLLHCRLLSSPTVGRLQCDPRPAPCTDQLPLCHLVRLTQRHRTLPHCHSHHPHAVDVDVLTRCPLHCCCRAACRYNNSAYAEPSPLVHTASYYNYSATTSFRFPAALPQQLPPSPNSATTNSFSLQLHGHLAIPQTGNYTFNCTYLTSSSLTAFMWSVNITHTLATDRPLHFKLTHPLAHPLPLADCPLASVP